MPQSERRTAYVLKVYPRFSETFIVTEVLAREAAGEDLEIFALRPTTDTRFHPEIARVQAPVRHIAKPHKLSDGWAAMARAEASIPGFADRFAALLPELAAYDAADVHQAVLVAAEAAERGITHLHGHFASLAGQTAELAAQLAGIEYSVTMHAKDIFHSSVDPERLTRTISRSHHAVTISQYNLDHLAAAHPDAAGKLSLVYNGLELARFPYRDPRPLTAGAPLRIAAVGRMVEKKGFADLVRATSALTAAGTALDVRIAGEGELFETLADQIAEAGLGEVITLLGAQTQAEIRELLDWADVFAAPCVVGADGNADGLPTVLLEAMATGVPCVASTVTGIPEAVIDGETGFLHAPGDVDGLIRALTRIADPAFDRVGLARAGRKHIESRFDSGVQAAHLIALEDAAPRPLTAAACADVADDAGDRSASAPMPADDPADPESGDLAGVRIAYVSVDPGIPVFGTKGASVHVQEVVRELISRGAEVTIFASRGGDDVPADLDGVEAHIEKIRTKETGPREAAQRELSYDFARRIAAGGFDLVIERYSLFSRTIAAVREDAGIPGILEVNAPLIDEQRTHRELIAADDAYAALRQQTQAAVRTYAVSRAVADWVEQTAGVRDVLPVPNGVNTDRIVPGDGQKTDGPPTVAFVGTLKPWHGVDVLVDALAASRGDWRLRVIGGGPMGEALRAQVAEAGAGHRVEFTGAVSPSEVPGLLSDCALAVAPYPAVAAEDSYFSPLKVYEYLAAGLPVVASAIGQIPQVLTSPVPAGDDGPEAPAGVLVTPSDAAELASAIDALAADAPRRRDMARAARRLAVAEHSWAHALDRILDGIAITRAEPASAADHPSTAAGERSA